MVAAHAMTSIAASFSRLLIRPAAMASSIASSSRATLLHPIPQPPHLIRGARKPTPSYSDSPLLQNCFQKKGVISKVYTTKPKKPNSAVRKVCRVKLSTGKTTIAYIPGEGHNLQEHGVVLVRGGRTKDLPGIRYKVVRGALDTSGVAGRMRARSKYGVKKPKATA